LLNQDSATGIYKTIAETQRGFCQTFELRSHSAQMPGRALILESRDTKIRISLIYSH
jgi:hypothetical protein